MKQKNKGYLIPSNPVADDCGCIVVFYPDRDEYLYALMGALQYFETWVAWEKNDDKTGRVAAEQWKEANEITRDNMNCSMGIREGLEAIAAAMSGMNDDGCCGAVGAGDTIGDVPVWIDGDGQVGTGGDPISPPAGWPVGEVYSEYKCRAANAIVYDLVATLTAMSTLSGLFVVMGTVAFYALLNTPMISGLVVGLMAVGLSASGAVLLLLAAFVGMGVTGGAALAVLAVLATNLDAEGLVCELYAAETAVDAETSVINAIGLAFDLIGGSEEKSMAVLFVEKVSDILLGESLFNALFNYDEDIAVREGAYSCECYPDLTSFTISRGGGTAEGWIDGEVIDSSKVYVIRGEGNDVTKHNTAFASISFSTAMGGTARAKLKILDTSTVNTCPDCATNNEHSFWIPYLSPSNIVDWGYCLIPPAGYIQDFCTWIQMRGNPYQIYRVSFRVVAAEEV